MVETREELIKKYEEIKEKASYDALVKAKEVDGNKGIPDIFLIFSIFVMDIILEAGYTEINPDTKKIELTPSLQASVNILYNIICNILQREHSAIEALNTFLEEGNNRLKEENNRNEI